MIDPHRTLWGGPASPPCILTSVIDTARRFPEAPAVIDETGEYSYAQLMTWVRSVDKILAAQQVSVGDRVAITGARSAATVAAFLALMARGATYVPLDPTYPARRISHMLSDSGTKLVLYAGDRPEFDAVPIPAPGGPGGDLPTVACGPDLPIYIIYTSGSTGWPKGVAVAHQCLDNMAEWQWRHSPRAGLRTAQFAPLNFDVFFQEVLGSLCGGGTVIVMPEQLRRDPMGLITWLARHRVERLFMPYVALQMLAVAATMESSLERLSLVEVNTAGEQMVCTPQIRELFARMPGCRLVNHYGQSESAMVTSHILAGPSSQWPALPPIGVPLPGCEVLIDVTDPAEPDVGELIVAGLPVSVGYLGAAELNAARYLTVPPTPQGHTRVFRTGDLVRIADGVVHFLNRIDDEVKIRGVRVNLLEIDAWLLDQPGVAAAAAVLVANQAGHKTLRAAYVAEGVDADAVLKSIGEVLPEVSIPKSLTLLTEMPRTPSGKIDRDAVAAHIATDLASSLR